VVNFTPSMVFSAFPCWKNHRVSKFQHWGAEISARRASSGASRLRRESRMVASHGIESKEHPGRHRFLRRR
jgi:hypothetical protein